MYVAICSEVKSHCHYELRCYSKTRLRNFATPVILYWVDYVVLNKLNLNLTKFTSASGFRR